MMPEKWNVMALPFRISDSNVGGCGMPAQSGNGGQGPQPQQPATVHRNASLGGSLPKRSCQETPDGQIVFSQMGLSHGSLGGLSDRDVEIVVLYFQAKQNCYIKSNPQLGMRWQK